MPRYDMLKLPEICVEIQPYGKLKVEPENKLQPDQVLQPAPSSREKEQTPHQQCAGATNIAGHSPKKGAKDTMTDMFENAPDLGKQLGIALDESPKQAVEIDMAKYQAYLDDEDLDQDQKEEIVSALWSIITAFVDLGFGVHPMQEVCGKVDEQVELESNEDSNETVPAPTTISDAFKIAAGKPFEPSDEKRSP